MEREFEIFGKNLEEDDVKKATTDIVDYREKFLQKMDGELEKTPEELKFIKFADKSLREEYKELDIEEKNPRFKPEQFHIYPEKQYINRFSNFSNRGVDAFYDPDTDGVIFKKSNDRISLYYNILHEGIHVDSFHKYLINKDTGKTSTYRTGYLITDERKSDQENKYFERLRLINEAIVEKTTRDVFRKNINKFINDFAITEEEIKKSRHYTLYDCILDVMENIVAEVAKKKGENQNTIWRRLKRGLFTGEMMHLRDFEKYADKGLLNKLANIKSIADAERELPKRLTESEISIGDKKYKLKWGRVYGTN